MNNHCRKKPSVWTFGLAVLFSLLLLNMFSCNPQAIRVYEENLKNSGHSVPVVSSANYSDGAITLSGKNLSEIVKIRIRNAPLIISQKTNESVILRSQSPLNLVFNEVYDLVISTAHAEMTTVPIVISTSEGFIITNGVMHTATELAEASHGKAARNCAAMGAAICNQADYGQANLGRDFGDSSLYTGADAQLWWNGSVSLNALNSCMKLSCSVGSTVEAGWHTYINPAKMGSGKRRTHMC